MHLDLLWLLPTCLKDTQRNPYSLTIPVTLPKSEPDPLASSSRFSSTPSCLNPQVLGEVSAFSHELNLLLLRHGGHRSVAEETWHPSKSTSKKGKSPDPFGEWREHKSPSYHKSANQSKLSRSTLVSFPSHCQPALPSYGQGANHPGLPQPPLQTKANTCGLSNLSSENVSCNVTLL